MAEARYINPYTDFGFKKLFGTELNKDLLISFLNALFSKSQKIVLDEITDVKYLNSEQLGRSKADRKAVYDVYCQTKSGGKFIVEMQNAFQQFFKDRSIFYASFPIRDMAKKDTVDERWNYELQPLYTIGILNFVFKDDAVVSNGDGVVMEESADEFRHDVMLTDTNNDNKIFYKKLAFIYLEMPKFKKTIEQCESFYDKWMFVLQNLSRLMERPKELQERIFKKVFEQAEIAKYTPEEHSAYEESLKNLRDFNSIESSARNEGIRLGLAQGLAQGLTQGREEGLAQGLTQGEKQKSLEIAKNLKASGLDVDFIAQNTGLTKEEISKL